ncbi:MAG TPA: tetratricopeptide repeat protein [Candidatus Krumholzibacteria bacterium]|nr:tetratricopeptide repeat protein [Candidatus Krumholzibacteria bacterium]
MTRSWTLFVVAFMLLPVALIAKSVETTSGIIYIQNKQYEEARKILLKAIDKDPKDGEAHFYLGLAYSEMDSVALAYNHFTKAKELEPKKARDIANNIQSNYARHYKAGQDAFKQQDVNRAAAQFELATQADPTQSAGHYNLAVMYSRLAQIDSTYEVKALAGAEKVLELAPPSDANYTRALQLAVRSLAQLGRVDEAVGRVQAMIDKDPSKYPAVEEIGNELYNARNYKGAEPILIIAANERAKAGADDFDVYSKIAGSALAQRKEDPAKIEVAIEYYTRALDLKSDDAPTVLNLMVAHMAKEDWGGAAMWGEKYVQANPNDATAWQYLASCYGEMGETDKASEALQRFQQLKGQ